MGYFTIKLGNNKKGNVRFGTIRKMKKISHFFRRKKLDGDLIGYIVTVDIGFGSENVFYLTRSKEGEWINERQDEETIAVKKAIDEFETYVAPKYPPNSMSQAIPKCTMSPPKMLRV